MASLKEFFGRHQDDMQRGIAQKNTLLKRNVIAYLAVNGSATLAQLTRKLHISVPTITKLVGELVDERLVTAGGKVETTGGRRPNVFGLAGSAIYFAGVDVGRDTIRCLVTDIHNNIVARHYESYFKLEDTPECLERICSVIECFAAGCGIDRGKILGMGVCMAGRVNPNTGRSYKYFTDTEVPLRELVERRTGITVLLENDTRARCYAEYFDTNPQGGHNMLYLHLGRGIAIGIVVDGKLYYGKSGFAGEFGHTPFFDNDVICACGKKGCLETEVSGIALESRMEALIAQGVNTVLRGKWERGAAIHVDDIVDAALRDDNLAIELIEQAGEKIGRSVAVLINIFNPETVIIGGNLSRAGDYILRPLQSATNKYSLNLVYRDTTFRISHLSDTGAVGAAMLIRNKMIGL